MASARLPYAPPAHSDGDDSEEEIQHNGNRKLSTASSSSAQATTSPPTHPLASRSSSSSSLSPLDSLLARERRLEEEETKFTELIQERVFKKGALSSFDQARLAMRTAHGESAGLADSSLAVAQPDALQYYSDLHMQEYVAINMGLNAGGPMRRVSVRTRVFDDSDVVGELTCGAVGRAAAEEKEREEKEKEKAMDPLDLNEAAVPTKKRKTRKA